MFCPYLGEEVPDAEATREHVVPYALGGADAFTISVSRSANSRAGHQVDSLLVNNFFMTVERLAFDLCGQSGNPPSYRIRGTLEANGRVLPARTTISAAPAEVWTAPEVERFTGEDGSEQIRIRCRLEDVDRILDDINRKLAAQGKAPIDKVAFKASATIESDPNARMRVEDSQNVAAFERPFVKIALGAAHYALGDVFSRSEDAALLRRVMWESDDAAREDLRLHGAVWPYVPNPERYIGIFSQGDKHIVALMNTGPLGAVIILFGRYVALVQLSEDVERFHPMIGDGVVYVVDPSNRTLETMTHRQAIATAIRLRVAERERALQDAPADGMAPDV